MSFMDNLKRSLGYEETETTVKKDNKESALDNLSAMINNLTKTENRTNNSYQQPNRQQYQQPKPTQRPNPNPAPVYDEYEVIIP